MRVNVYWTILCFVDRSSRYIRVMKTSLMHYFSSVYFVSQPLHLPGIFVAHHQTVFCIYATIGRCCAFFFCLLSDSISLHGCILDSCTENVWHNKTPSLSMLNIPLEDEVVEFQT